MDPLSRGESILNTRRKVIVDKEGGHLISGRGLLSTVNRLVLGVLGLYGRSGKDDG